MMLLAEIAQQGSALQPVQRKIDPQRCMGKWFVQRAIPAVAALEKTAHNGCEVYKWDPELKRVEVTYTFNAGSFDGPQRTVRQKGRIENAEGTQWAVSPQIAGFGLPVQLPFLIVDVDDVEYSYLTCTGGLNSWLYIMTRDMQPDATMMENLEKTVENMGFDMGNVISMPHRA